MSKLLAITTLSAVTALAAPPAPNSAKTRVTWTEEMTNASQNARDLAHLKHKSDAENFNIRYKVADKKKDTLLIFRPTTAWTKESVAECLKAEGPTWQKLGFINIVFLHSNPKTLKAEGFQSFKLNAHPAGAQAPGPLAPAAHP
nr:hypothetical protein [uncultured Holophaga sp.]